MDVISLAGRQSETSCRTSCWGWERRASYEVQHLAREGAGETRGFVGQCVEGLCGGDVVGGTIDEGAYGPYLAAFSGVKGLASTWPTISISMTAGMAAKMTGVRMGDRLKAITREAMMVVKRWKQRWKRRCGLGPILWKPER